MYASFAMLGGGYFVGWAPLILTHGLGGFPVVVADVPTMQATSEDYQQQLIDLLPPGPAWNK